MAALTTAPGVSCAKRATSVHPPAKSILTGALALTMFYSPRNVRECVATLSPEFPHARSYALRRGARRPAYRGHATAVPL